MDILNLFNQYNLGHELWTEASKVYNKAWKMKEDAENSILELIRKNPQVIVKIAKVNKIRAIMFYRLAFPGTTLVASKDFVDAALAHMDCPDCILNSVDPGWSN